MDDGDRTVEKLTLIIHPLTFLKTINMFLGSNAVRGSHFNIDIYELNCHFFAVNTSVDNVCMRCVILSLWSIAIVIYLFSFLRHVWRHTSRDQRERVSPRDPTSWDYQLYGGYRFWEIPVQAINNINKIQGERLKIYFAVKPRAIDRKKYKTKTRDREYIKYNNITLTVTVLCNWGMHPHFLTLYSKLFILRCSIFALGVEAGIWLANRAQAVVTILACFVASAWRAPVEKLWRRRGFYFHFVKLWV